MWLIIGVVDNRWHGGITVWMLDSRSEACKFDSWSDHVVTTSMGDCLWTGKPSRYITNTKVNSAFHSSVVGKSNTGPPACMAGVQVGHVHLCRVSGNTVIPYCR